jgi:PhnB protein
MWWVYQHGEAPELDWDSADGETDSDSAEWSDPDLAYIHRTVLEAMPSLGMEAEDGRERR